MTLLPINFQIQGSHCIYWTCRPAQQSADTYAISLQVLKLIAAQKVTIFPSSSLRYHRLLCQHILFKIRMHEWDYIGKTNFEMIY